MLALLILWAMSTVHADYPENTYLVPAHTRSGLGKAQFDDVLNKFEARHSHRFARVGCRLELIRDWADPTSNAYAERVGSVCKITMLGGMARNPYMTKAGFMGVVLHEAGHHLAGAPLYVGSPLSCEGQADYFAGLTGNSLSGNLSLAKVLAHLGGYQMPSRPGPRLPNVSRTNCSHPKPQCRLNTMDVGRGFWPRPKCWYAGL